MLNKNKQYPMVNKSSFSFNEGYTNLFVSVQGGRKGPQNVCGAKGGRKWFICIRNIWVGAKCIVIVIGYPVSKLGSGQSLASIRQSYISVSSSSSRICLTSVSWWWASRSSSSWICIWWTASWNVSSSSVTSSSCIPINKKTITEWPPPHNSAVESDSQGDFTHISSLSRI